MTQPDDDQAEGDPQYWAGLWDEMRTEDRDDGTGERTTARNVYVRLLLARLVMKLIRLKTLEIYNVNFVLGYKPEGRLTSTEQHFRCSLS